VRPEDADGDPLNYSAMRPLLDGRDPVGTRGYSPVAGAPDTTCRFLRRKRANTFLSKGDAQGSRKQTQD
jgi:hypothetical protein